MKPAFLIAAASAIATLCFAPIAMSAQKPVCDDLQVYQVGACTCVYPKVYQKIGATHFKCTGKNKK
jgi:hypothetical protein